MCLREVNNELPSAFRWRVVQFRIRLAKKIDRSIGVEEYFKSTIIEEPDLDGESVDLLSFKGALIMQRASWNLNLMILVRFPWKLQRPNRKH
jgi:hypothetical protein